MQLTDNPYIRNLGKVVAAGASIFAIGWGMLVLQPEPEAPVATAEADIFGFEFAQKTQQQKFLTSLMNEGMEEPRAYDHNGNKMFFSTVVTEESPRQVLERFQRSFVETGLNERVHLTPPQNPGPGFPTVEELEADKSRWNDMKPLLRDRKAYVDDFVGGMVPSVVTPDGVVMVGTTTKKSGNDTFDWAVEVAEQVKELPKGGKMDMSQSMKAMRYMDAFRESDGRTRITAVWSDEDYEALKIVDIGEDLNVDPEVPICPGCSRLLQFSGETEKDYANTAIDGGSQSIDQVLGFYQDVLPARGWKLSDTAAVLAEAERQGIKPRTGPQMLQFTRGTQFMTIAAWPGEKGTSVQVARSN